MLLYRSNLATLLSDIIHKFHEGHQDIQKNEKTSQSTHALATQKRRYIALQQKMQHLPRTSTPQMLRASHLTWKERNDCSSFIVRTTIWWSQKSTQQLLQQWSKSLNIIVASLRNKKFSKRKWNWVHWNTFLRFCEKFKHHSHDQLVAISQKQWSSWTRREPSPVLQKKALKKSQDSTRCYKIFEQQPEYF